MTSQHLLKVLVWRLENVLLSLLVVENEAASFPWSCPSLSGVCRKVCLPTEMFFGPLGCGKGFLCCVSHFL
uniref:Beta-defensin n=1 Tax=Fundulus heteroclitus TaxID=8078 RepID=A0A3Q2QUF3_FUNHE